MRKDGQCSDDPPSATVPTLAELHRRWAALQDELVAITKPVWSLRAEAGVDRPASVQGLSGPLRFNDEIDAEIDERLRAARRPAQRAKLERERQRLKTELRDVRAARDARAEAIGLTAIAERYGRLGEEINQLADQMRNAPIASIADVAALLDVILRQELRLVPSQVGVEHPWLTLLLRGLRRHAPAIHFEPIRAWATSDAHYDLALDTQAAYALAALNPE